MKQRRSDTDSEMNVLLTKWFFVRVQTAHVWGWDVSHAGKCKRSGQKLSPRSKNTQFILCPDLRESSNATPAAATQTNETPLWWKGARINAAFKAHP